MELNLEGKVVVITGGATGIGRETARQFLREGCRVAICGRRREKLDEAAGFFAGEGHPVFTESLDVRDEAALKAFGKHVFEAFGRIDVWINNAGFNIHRRMVDLPLAEFHEIMDVNLTAVFLGCRTAWEYMKGKGGVILNASGYSGLVPFAGRGPYGAAKAAVISLTNSFAAEFARDNIRVLAYVPGMIETDMSRLSIQKYGDGLLRDIPMRRFGQPAELAKMLVVLASDAASYVNGAYVFVGGGKRCVQNPWYAYEEAQ
ncbi:MAG: SDR family oxidoreductase [Spirochaetia bacterium]|jgi:3-oxoacyl-[acyl-carrier protein] reductase|nr:SDR family oxidoreductase [Spirochaetia bacterium]